MFSLMCEILHALRDVLHSCGRFYMFGLRAWEIESRRETHDQCVRVDSHGYTSPHLLCIALLIYQLRLRKLRTSKKIFTAPRLKNLIAYIYWLPKCHVKILRDKKWWISFYFTLSKMGILHVSLCRLAK